MISIARAEKKTVKRTERVRKYIYSVLTETQCKAKTHYWKYWQDVGVKAWRDRRCSFYTVRWCGFCPRHCKELCGEKHYHVKKGRP